MLNVGEIDKEIRKLEACESTTYGVVEKLASLYIVRDYFQKSDEDRDVKVVSELMNRTDSGVFRYYASHVEDSKFRMIMCDAMNKVMQVAPDLYAEVVEQIRGAI